MCQALSERTGGSTKLETPEFGSDTTPVGKHAREERETDLELDEKFVKAAWIANMGVYELWARVVETRAGGKREK